MTIALFELNEKLRENLSNKITTFPNETTFNRMMAPMSISASFEGISRLLSHVICESLDSYTQQSQRYVPMSDSAFITPKEIEESRFHSAYEALMKDIFEFYHEITQAKPEKKRGRGSKADDYEFGIPIEDGRYIIPLAAKTNVMATLSGNKAVNFARNLFEQPQKEAHEHANDFIASFDDPLIESIIDKHSHSNAVDTESIQKIYQEMFDKIDKNAVLFDKFNNPIHRVALGGLSSTNPNTPSSVYAKWEPEYDRVRFQYSDDKSLQQRFQKFLEANYSETPTEELDEKKPVLLMEWLNSFEPTNRATGIAEKILGYGHESIAEHSRTTYGTEQSLTSYHQFERHRLPSNIRERFSDIPVDRTVFVPPTVEKSEKNDEFLEMVDRVKDLREDMINNGYQNAASYLLLNCDGVKVITNSNARIDKQMLEQRTCENAQWEIRDRAQALIGLLKDTVPYIYKRSGPPCTKSDCPEGELSCGKYKVKRKYYGYFGD